MSKTFKPKFIWTITAWKNSRCCKILFHSHVSMLISKVLEHRAYISNFEKKKRHVIETYVTFKKNWVLQMVYQSEWHSSVSFIFDWKIKNESDFILLKTIWWNITHDNSWKMAREKHRHFNFAHFFVLSFSLLYIELERVIKIKLVLKKI